MKSCVIYRTKKTKFQLPLKLSLLRGSRPKLPGPAPNNVLTSAPDFIQIDSLFGGVIADCVNTVFLPVGYFHDRLSEPIIIRHIKCSLQ